MRGYDGNSENYEPEEELFDKNMFSDDDELYDASTGFGVDDELYGTSTGFGVDDELYDTSTGLGVDDELYDASTGFGVDDELYDASTGFGVDDELYDTSTELGVDDELYGMPLDELEAYEATVDREVSHIDQEIEKERQKAIARIKKKLELMKQKKATLEGLSKEDAQSEKDDLLH